MKFFEVGYDAGVYTSVNTIIAEDAENAAKIARKHADRYGYAVGYVKEISARDAEYAREKGRPTYAG